MHKEIIIPAQFRGPPDSGNGGYVGGVFASLLRPMPLSPSSDDAETLNATEVTLRAPTPLDTPLRVDQVDRDRINIHNGQTLVAEVSRTTLDLEVPKPPEYQAAESVRDASPSFIPGINPHLTDGTGFHPICFCCGADVDPGQGLRIFAAAVPGFDGVAAAWRPHPAFAGEAGYLPSAIIWAALDCPGQFAYFAAGIRTGMLGRMTARMLSPVRADAELVVIGWRMEVERQKYFAGTALFDETGNCCAYSKQTWIGRRN